MCVCVCVCVWLGRLRGMGGGKTAKTSQESSLTPGGEGTIGEKGKRASSVGRYNFALPMFFFFFFFFILSFFLSFSV